MTEEELENNLKLLEEDIQTRENYLELMKNKKRDLQKQLEKCGKRWRADEGEEYWFVNSGGDIEQYEEHRTYVDDYSYSTGNYFKTIPEAEAYKQALEKIQECECEVEIHDNIKNYSVHVDYIFDTESEAESFAQDLKLILKCEGE
jgi:hypothetical protein